MKEIEIKIDQKGNVTYKVHGIKGEKCKHYSRFIEDAVGEVITREVTEEYYEKEEDTTKDYFTER
ncbi:MAG TPA: DUF2997 domain-containing protein [bacterium]|nr:DUF2997 domain-containing protein [bacterium]